MPLAENSQIPVKIFERFSREPHFEKIEQEAHIEKFSGGTLFVDLQRTEIGIFISQQIYFIIMSHNLKPKALKNC